VTGDSDPAAWLPTDAFDPAQGDNRLQPLTGHFDGEGRVREPADGDWRSNVWAEGARANTLYRVLTPGGGGWGPAAARDPSAVLRDVRDGIVSVESALADYRVVVTGDPSEPRSLAVDAEGTRRAREEQGA
jgi:N-methylhydantoinase B